MITVDERLAFVEGRVTEHSQTLAGLPGASASFEERLDRMDNRLDRIEIQLDGLRTEMSMNFRWIVGIQLTTSMTIVAALVALR